MGRSSNSRRAPSMATIVGGSGGFAAAFEHRTHDDVREAIEHHWSTLPDGLRGLLADSPPPPGTSGVVTLRALLDFWLGQPLDLLEMKMTSTMCGSSWYLANAYLQLGNARAARNLMLNGGLLQEAYYTPVSEIVEAARAFVPFQEGGEDGGLRRFRAVFRAVSSVDSMHKFLKLALPMDYQRMMSELPLEGHGGLCVLYSFVVRSCCLSNAAVAHRLRLHERERPGVGLR